MADESDQKVHTDTRFNRTISKRTVYSSQNVLLSPDNTKRVQEKQELKHAIYRLEHINKALHGFWGWKSEYDSLVKTLKAALAQEKEHLIKSYEEQLAKKDFLLKNKEDEIRRLIADGDRLNKNLSDATFREQKAQEEIRDLTLKLQRLEEANRNLNADLLKKTKENEDLTFRLKKEVSVNSELGKKIVDLDRVVIQLREKEDEIVGLKHRLQDEIKQRDVLQKMYEELKDLPSLIDANKFGHIAELMNELEIKNRQELERIRAEFEAKYKEESYLWVEQQQELREQIISLSKTIEDKNREIEDRERELARQLGRLAELERLSKELKVELDRANDRFQLKSKDFDGLQNDLFALRKRAEGLEVEFKQSLAHRAENEKRIQDLDGDIRRLNSALKNAQLEKTEFVSKYNDLSLLFTNLKDKELPELQRKYQEKLKFLERDFDSKKRTYSEMVEEKYKLQKEIEDLKSLNLYYTEELKQLETLLFEIENTLGLSTTLAGKKYSFTQRTVTETVSTPLKSSTIRQSGGAP